MTTLRWTLPPGEQVLGRIVSPNGEPLDGLGALKPRESSASQTAATPVQTGQLVETGIKVLDVFAPITHGAVLKLVSGAGVGKLVLMSELIARMVQRYNGTAVLVGVEEHTLEVNDMMRMMREAGVHEQIAMVFARNDHDAALRQQALPTGWALANDLSQSGPVLLFIDRQIALEQGVEQPASPTTGQPITVCYLDREDTGQPDVVRRSVQPDTTIVLSRELAQQQIWPAIDPRQSHSRLLADGSVSADHTALVKRAQTILAQPDHPIAQQVLLFGSQPFFTAELYTGKPGEYVPLEQALADYARLLDGQYAAMPLDTIRFIGVLAQTTPSHA